jgi:hypothetical protein
MENPPIRRGCCDQEAVGAAGHAVDGA